MAEKSETIELAEKLLAKTSEGRISWEPSYESETFAAVLRGGLSFQIERNEDWYRLKMTDELNNTLISLSASERARVPDPSEEKILGVLKNLHEAARWQALKIDGRLSQARIELDQL